MRVTSPALDAPVHFGDSLTIFWEVELGLEFFRPQSDKLTLVRSRPA